jgi:hypothetical protein
MTLNSWVMHNVNLFNLLNFFAPFFIRFVIWMLKFSFSSVECVCSVNSARDESEDHSQRGREHKRSQNWPEFSTIHNFGVFIKSRFLCSIFHFLYLNCHQRIQLSLRKQEERTWFIMKRQKKVMKKWSWFFFIGDKMRWILMMLVSRCLTIKNVQFSSSLSFIRNMQKRMIK